MSLSTMVTLSRVALADQESSAQRRETYGISHASTSLKLLLLIGGTFRRLARRGGVKRLSGTIYDEVRNAMKDRIQLV